MIIIIAEWGFSTHLLDLRRLDTLPYGSNILFLKQMSIPKYIYPTDRYLDFKVDSLLK